MANPKGPLATKNNLTGITQVDVVLSGTTPKTWTHSCAAKPLAVMLFVTASGAPVLEGAGTGQVATTCPSTDTICLTPGSSVSPTALIWWNLPSDWTNGAPAANFI